MKNSFTEGMYYASSILLYLLVAAGVFFAIAAAVCWLTSGPPNYERQQRWRTIEGAIGKLFFYLVAVPICAGACIVVLCTPIYDLFYTIAKPVDWIIGFIALGTSLGCIAGPLFGWVMWSEKKNLSNAVAVGALVVLWSPYFSCAFLSVLWCGADI
jgi:hypothetical protein